MLSRAWALLLQKKISRRELRLRFNTVLTFTTGCKVLGQWFSSFNGIGITEGLVKSQRAGPHPQSFRFSRSRVGPVICMSKKF